MRSMTEAEATYYIKAGYFPYREDIDAIVDLQDVFGHQRMWAIYKWLYDKHTKKNAERLFRLIWAKDVVDNYIQYVDKIRAKEEEALSLQRQIKELQAQYDSVWKSFAKDVENMNDMDFEAEVDEDGEWRCI